MDISTATTRKIFFVSVNDISETSNFHRTVLEGVALKDYPTLVPFAKKDRIFLWGINEKIKASFNSIRQGDIALFYHRQKVVAIGSILDKTVNRNLSESLWGSFQKFSIKSYWSNIIIFDAVELVDVDFAKISKLGNYKQGFTIRKMIPANETLRLEFWSQFKSMDDFVAKNK